MKPRNPTIHLHEKKLMFLEEMAMTVREDVIDMLVEAGSGHSAGSLGMADIFVTMYFHILVHDPKHPFWQDRDRLVLSNGHICPVQYATMARAGYFPLKQLLTLRKLGSPLQGHPEREKLPGIETSSGPLGSGSSQAAGMAYALAQDKAPGRVYCLMSDGELDAGQTWEAMLFAGRNHLNNLTFIIDRNNIQIDGTTEEIMPLEPLKKKFNAFNLHAIQCAGNNISDFVRAISQAHAVSEKATVIIADTIPGAGVSFMENDFTWHGATPSAGVQSRQAIKEIRTLAGRIKADHD